MMYILHYFLTFYRLNNSLINQEHKIMRLSGYENKLWIIFSY